MLENLELRHFRGFGKHALRLEPLSILIGVNNAGKTTVVDSLRLISLVTRKFRHLNYRRPPEGFDLPMNLIGVSPNTDELGLNWRGIVQSPEDIGSVTAEFFNGSKVTVYVRDSDNRIFGVIYDRDGNIVSDQRWARDVDVPQVRILPPLSHPRNDEVRMNPETVRKNQDGRLSALCFRNQLIRSDDSVYKRFTDLIAENWQSIKIQELIPGDGDHFHQLIVRTPRHAGELSEMGSGLQMWLQIMWFIARCETTETVVLDEPDVHLHPDLQRNLMRAVRDRFSQVIATTHSIDIISEVDPQQLIVIDKDQECSLPLNSLPSVQKVIEEMGSTQNFQLAKLWTAKTYLLLEGKSDRTILSIVQEANKAALANRLVDVPYEKTNGWEDWNFARGAVSTMRNAMKSTINVYSIFDSDYRSIEEIEARYQKAKQHKVNLHVWRKKEIENYLLCERAIVRLINRRRRRDVAGEAGVKEMQKWIGEIVNDLCPEVIAKYEELQLARQRNRPGKGFRAKINEIVEARAAVAGGMHGLVPGKVVIKRLSQRVKEKYGVSLSPAGIAREMRMEEFDKELRDVVDAIQSGQKFGYAV